MIDCTITKVQQTSYDKSVFTKKNRYKSEADVEIREQNLSVLSLEYNRKNLNVRVFELNKNILLHVSLVCLDYKST